MGLLSCPTDLEAQVQRMPEAFTHRDCVAWEEKGDRSGSSSCALGVMGGVFTKCVSQFHRLAVYPLCKPTRGTSTFKML